MAPRALLPGFEHISGLLEFEENSPRLRRADHFTQTGAHVKQEELDLASTSSVQFSVVEVIQFNRSIDDHPDTKRDKSLAIGSDCSEREVLSLDEYEHKRFLRRQQWQQPQQPRRPKNDRRGLTPWMKQRVRKGSCALDDNVKQAEKKEEQTQRRKERRAKIHPFVMRTEDSFRLATKRIRNRLGIERRHL
eukprot:CAMPEP_0197437168 /NCGR_PEP_ID=MMETSP1175-20131217/4456_1 /TAXON_ID=1003142 /ORGANISM="Triceratium dubium, Strain CCMP147" /LENGTH=190 /DNA_ID=CAMNT_0042966617 /DNA_START=260 /DNA_END=832 /DNA_ORIENTATION=-